MTSHFWSGRRFLSAVVASWLLLQSACAFLYSRPPLMYEEQQDHGRCSDAWLPPTLDLLGAGGGGTLSTLALLDYRDCHAQPIGCGFEAIIGGAAGLVGLVYLSSSIYGYYSMVKCQQCNATRQRRLMGNQAARLCPAGPAEGCSYLAGQ